MADPSEIKRADGKQPFRDALRAIISIVGGYASDQTSDEFLCEAPAEVLHFVRKITAERDKAVSDREMLISIVGSVPDHETSASAMANAYWNWREKMKPAIASARALQRKLSKQAQGE
jgi:hypothetical protein